MTVKELTKLLSNFDENSTLTLAVEGDYDSETASIEVTGTNNNVTLVIHEDFSITTHPNKFVLSYWRGERYRPIGQVQAKQFDTQAAAEAHARRLTLQGWQVEWIKV